MATSSPRSEAPPSWRALFNEVFGLERWSVLLTYTFPDSTAAAMPKLHVVAIPKRACKIVVQEWSDGGFSYFLETRHFDAGEVRQQLGMWRDNLI